MDPSPLNQPEAVPPPPRVSVVVVSYNSAGALRRCLQALDQSQARDRLEVIVVDRGSRDESPGLDTEFPGADFLRLPKNFGLTKSRNIGARSAKAEYILFLQPEIEVRPDTVDLLAGALDADPDAWAACPLTETPAGAPDLQVYRLPSRAGLDRAWKTGLLPEAAVDPAAGGDIGVDCASGSALMIRTHHLKSMNWFDERYGEYWSDVEACYQIRRASKKILLVTAARAVRHDDVWTPGDSAAKGQLSGDCALGAAAWTGKHEGFVPGLLHRIGITLSAIGLMLAGLSDFGFHFARVKALLTSQKVDGSQTAV